MKTPATACRFSSTPTGSIDFPAAYSGVLGLFSHWTYADHDVQLKSGDALVLMTDGVLEAFDENEEGVWLPEGYRLSAGQSKRGRARHSQARCSKM